MKEVHFLSMQQKVVMEEKAGHLLLGKGRSIKSPRTHLLRLRAPPHVQATLPSSGSKSDSDSSSDCSLYIPPGAHVQYSICCGKHSLKVTSSYQHLPRNSIQT